MGIFERCVQKLAENSPRLQETVGSAIANLDSVDSPFTIRWSNLQAAHEHVMYRMGSDSNLTESPHMNALLEFILDKNIHFLNRAPTNIASMEPQYRERIAIPTFQQIDEKLSAEWSHIN